MTNPTPTPSGPLTADHRPHGRRLRALHRTASATLALLLSGVLAAGQLASSGSTASSGPAVRVTDDQLRLVGASAGSRVKKALRVAKNQKGDKYKYGAEGPRRFDCSGLVYFSTHRAGFEDVPRTSAEQGRHMRHIKRKNLRRGDFVFFTGSSGVYHVGVYVGRRDGDRAIVHAPKPGTKVRVEKVWSDSWFAGTLRR